MVLATHQTIPVSNVDGVLRSLVDLEHVALLSSDQVLEWTRIVVVLNTSHTQHLVASTVQVVVKDELVGWTFIQHPLVPPQ